MKFIKFILFYLLFFTIALTQSSAQQSQYGWRVGIHSGVMGYYGDLSNNAVDINRPLKDFWKNLDYLSYGISAEKSLTNSWGIRLSGTYGQFIAGDRTYNFKGELNIDNPNILRGLEVKTDIKDLSFLFTYQIDNGKLFGERSFFSPYLVAGAGFTHFKTTADLFDERGMPYYYWTDFTIRDLDEFGPNSDVAVEIERDGNYETRLDGLRTEGVDYRTMALHFPVGLGLKFRFGDRINFNLESIVKYTTTDFLDDVSGDYLPSYDNTLQELAAHPGEMTGSTRGRPDRKANDIYWYSSISLHYNFGRKKEVFNAPFIYPGDLGSKKESSVINTETAEVAGPALMTEKPGNQLTEIPVAIDSAKSIIGKNKLAIDSVEKEIFLAEVAVDSIVTISDQTKIVIDSIDQDLARTEPALDSIEILISENESVLDSLKTVSETSVSKAGLDSLEKIIAGFYYSADSMKKILAGSRMTVDSMEFIVSRSKTAVDSMGNIIAGTRFVSDSLKMDISTIESAVDSMETVLEETIITTESPEIVIEDSTEVYVNPFLIVETPKVVVDLPEPTADPMAEQSTTPDSKQTTDDEKPRTTKDDSETAKVNDMLLQKLRYENELLLLKLHEAKTKDQRDREDQRSNETRENSSPEVSSKVEPLPQTSAPFPANDALSKSVAAMEQDMKLIKALLIALTSKEAVDIVAPEKPKVSESNSELTLVMKRLDLLEKQIGAANAATSGSENQKIALLENQLANLASELDALKKKPVVETAPVVVAPTPPAPVKTISTFDRNFKGLEITNIYFKTNSTEVDPLYLQRLQKIGELVNENGFILISITGFADKKGNPDYNLALSQKRADAVKRLLMQFGYVTPDRILIQFFGSSQSSGDPAFDRRVEVKLIKD